MSSALSVEAGRRRRWSGSGRRSRTWGSPRAVLEVPPDDHLGGRPAGSARRPRRSSGRPGCRRAGRCSPRVRRRASRCSATVAASNSSGLHSIWLTAGVSAGASADPSSIAASKLLTPMSRASPCSRAWTNPSRCRRRTAVAGPVDQPQVDVVGPSRSRLCSACPARPGLVRRALGGHEDVLAGTPLSASAFRPRPRCRRPWPCRGGGSRRPGRQPSARTASSPLICQVPKPSSGIAAPLVSFTVWPGRDGEVLSVMRSTLATPSAGEQGLGARAPRRRGRPARRG